MKIYFNSSFPRAGSTLLQNILAQNPRFYCTPTSGVFDLLLASRMNFSKLPEVQAQSREEMRKLFTGYCRGALEGAMGAMTDKPVAVDKSRGWMKEYDWLADFMPNPKIIVCVRDLRAILSSMEKGWRKYPHLQPGETLGDATGMKMVTIETRVAHWLNTAPLGAMVTHLLGQMERGQSPSFSHRPLRGSHGTAGTGTQENLRLP